MASLNILSAGAAQSVVASKVALGSEGYGDTFCTSFGAVQTVRSKVLAGETSDVVILSRALVDELIASQHLVSGSASDLGAVATGVAARTVSEGSWISSEDDLRRTMSNAASILCPDPKVATAGQVLVDALHRLGIHDAVEHKLVFFPSGSMALAKLAASGNAGDIAIVQVTEILGNRAVSMVGLLPMSLQQPTTYTAALSANSGSPERALAFIRSLTDDRGGLLAAGFGMHPGRAPAA